MNGYKCRDCGSLNAEDDVETMTARSIAHGLVEILVCRDCCSPMLADANLCTKCESEDVPEPYTICENCAE